MSKDQFQPLREDNPMLQEVQKLYETGSALNEVASPLGDGHHLYEHTNTVQNSGKNTDQSPKKR